VDELTRPFLDAWNYVGQQGGYPGQVFLCVLVVMVVIGGLTWFGNRR
jgi:hypothetical protein